MTTKIKQREVFGRNAGYERLYHVSPVSGPPPTMWPAPGEANTSAAWQDADMDSMQRNAVALLFATRIAQVESLESIWIKDIRDDLSLVIVLSEPDTELELRIRGIFIDLVCDNLDLSEGQLSAYSKDNVPTWVFGLKQLS